MCPASDYIKTRLNDPCLDSIEEWDEESETWTMSTMKLSEAKCNFGYCQLPSF